MPPVEQLQPILEFGDVILVIRNDVIGAGDVAGDDPGGTDFDAVNGANGTPYTIQGPILAKWETLNDAQKKDLGAPYDNEKKTKDESGVYQQFDGGVLIYRNGQPVYFVWGKIRDAWNANQASQGKLGYPTADEVTEPDGTFKSAFEHGTITWKTGDPDATVATS